MRIVLFLFLTSVGWLTPVADVHAREVRVGVFDNPPIVFRDDNGHVDGLAVEVLREVATREGWSLRFHFTDWESLLQQLRQSDLDLLIGIAHSEERARIYRFSDEHVLSNWAVVYRHPDALIDTLVDLNGQRVASMRDSIHTQALRDLITRFDLTLEIIEVSSYHEAMQAVDAGRADAAVVNRVYSIRKAAEHNVLPTPIVFNPVNVHFAAPKHVAPDLLIAIDKHLADMKRNPSSTYYQAVDRWMASSSTQLPRWVAWALMAAALILVLAVIVNALLRSQVRQQTEAIRGKARELEAEIAVRKETEHALLESEQRWNYALEGAGDGVWDWDTVTNDVFYSQRFKATLGYNDRDFANRFEEWDQRLHPEDREHCYLALDSHLAGESEQFANEHRLLCKNGQYKWFLGRGKVIYRDSEGNPLRMIGTLTDISDRKHTENALRNSEQRFRDVVRAAGEFVWEADARWRYIYISPRLSEILGYPEQDLLGHTPFEFVVAAAGGPAYLEERLRTGVGFRNLEYAARGADGREVWLQISGLPIEDNEGRIVGYRGTGSDISARKTAEARIEHLATRDPLTELPNRLLLGDRLQHAVIAAQRTQGVVAFLFIDLDRFKNINDSLGHHVGDELLKQVAARLQGAVRRGDTVARLGGDEFVILLEGLQQAEEVSPVVQKILQVIKEPYRVSQQLLNTSCSVGISLFPEDGDDLQTLLRNADTAMYHAKEHGRNQYQFFSADMNERAVQRLKLENALRQAVDNDEFSLVYQPQIDAASGRFIAVEALIRWNHPELGLVPPASFIPVAEETGLIVPIGTWVMDTACRQLAEWHRRGFTQLRIAVNLSGDQLSREGVDRFREIFRIHRIDPRLVELEITEGLLVHHTADNIEVLQQLRAMGAGVAVDDFGVGYSSLSYLKRFPITTLKIDRSFVRDLADDQDDAAIVQAIIAMSESLSLRVIAEGVETASQRDILRKMGCHELQGYFFSRPTTAPEVERMLKASPTPQVSTGS